MTTAVTRIGLGTVQLGMDYGVTNRAGRPNLAEAEAIIGVAEQHGVRVIDTAADYGESEQVLGQTLGTTGGFRIITKTPAIREPVIDSRHIDHVTSTFARSLQRLGVNHVDGLLVHHPDDLLSEGSDRLWETMCDLKAQGRVKKIGVSIYNEHQLSAVRDLFEVDLVQLPLNVLDQRALQSGTLASLQGAGIEVHARSAFLQGLLLSETDDLPEHFEPLREHLVRYHRFRKQHDLTAVQAALAFVLAAPVDCVVVGAARADEFAAVLTSAAALPEETPDFSEFACDDERYINPTQWAKP